MLVKAAPGQGGLLRQLWGKRCFQWYLSQSKEHNVQSDANSNRSNKKDKQFDAICKQIDVASKSWGKRIIYFTVIYCKKQQ